MSESGTIGSKCRSSFWFISEGVLTLERLSVDIEVFERRSVKFENLKKGSVEFEILDSRSAEPEYFAGLSIKFHKSLYLPVMENIFSKDDSISFVIPGALAIVECHICSVRPNWSSSGLKPESISIESMHSPVLEAGPRNRLYFRYPTRNISTGFLALKQYICFCVNQLLSFCWRCYNHLVCAEHRAGSPVP